MGKKTLTYWILAIRALTSFSSSQNFQESKDPRGKEISLFIGDTVLVNESSPATILTYSKKKIKNIAIFLKDDDESADEEKENSLPDPQNFGRGRRTALVDSKLRMDSTAEEKRKTHQKELMAKMNEEALRRIKAGGENVIVMFYCLIMPHSCP